MVVLGGADLLQGAVQRDCLHNNDFFVLLSKAIPFHFRNLQSLNWIYASDDATQDSCSF